MKHFWEKVEKSSGCWQWMAALDSDGYGSFHIDGHRRVAHRVSYQFLVGSIPDGLQLDHLCRNRACVNPAHLEPVTARENQRRADVVLGIRSAKTHCPKGHEYNSVNTYVLNSRRHCRPCNRAAAARYKARKGARS
jgi:hypothetical protein